MKKKQKKQEFLKKDGLLHRSPERVKNRLFFESDFFDPEDLMQVKYEMLRSVECEGLKVSTAADMFGFSRPSFYAIRGKFEKEGLLGLLTSKTGPKNAHKLTPEVSRFAETFIADSGKKANWEELSKLIEKRFNVSVHPRSIERHIKNNLKKKGEIK